VASLQDLGWCEFFEKQWQSNRLDGSIRARVSEENRGLYKVVSERGERWAELRGKLRHEAISREMLPAVGDWVLAEEHGERLSIHFVFERRSKFSLRIGGNAGGLSGGFVGDENLRAADRAALAGRNRTADGRRSCFLSDSDGQKAGENQAKATKAPQ